ncbi:MAG: NYN domain-containing protein [Candidatus Nealsonbacteria bacterium]
MDEKTKKVLEGLKDKKVGVFCDNANLYHSYQKQGWKIDLKKLKELIGQYCDLQFIYYYLVIPAKNDIVYHKSQKFLEKIKSFAIIKKKELKYTPIGGQVVKKGNMDIEIALDVVRNIDNLDTIIVMSGDSDFYELKNYVVRDKNKNIMFIGYEENMAWELRQCWHLYLNRIKDEIKLK